MEFEDEHDEEQEIEEEDEEEIATPPSASVIVPPSYDSVIPNSVSTSQRRPIHQASGSERRSDVLIKYMECLKNYAVNISGYSLDGCNGFMPGGEEGSIEALRYAVCNSHRNFHRKEAEKPTSNNGILSPPPQNPIPTSVLYPHFTAYYQNILSGSGYRPLTTIPITPGVAEGSGGHPTKKRFRTKFTHEQKDMMFAFAERLGWRIQKQDEGIVEEFCGEIDVKRQVLKVWMHNNKHAMGKMT